MSLFFTLKERKQLQKQTFLSRKYWTRGSEGARVEVLRQLKPAGAAEESSAEAWKPGTAPGASRLTGKPREVPSANLFGFIFYLNL